MAAAQRVLFQFHDFAAEFGFGTQAGHKSSRQPVGAANDLVELLRPHLFALFAQMLGCGAGEQRFRAVGDGQHFNSFLR